MAKMPRISIITPSFNQGRFIGETLQSLVDQEYPNLQVIIQDGGSTDGAVAIAESFVKKHPNIFQLHVEKDSGQSDALNRGFARADGEILGFLNSDDTLYPGTLTSVAREINPSRNRLIVMGRSLFTGEGSPYVGVEHPSVYLSHFEQLAIWKRGYNTIPQPSVFWHRRVWEKCGGFNTTEHHALDYDLFCRFSQHFRFHKVDELWSTYRMHAVSKSAQRTEQEVLDLSIKVSRRYWRGWWSPLRWRCELSYWLHNRHLHEHARHHARRAEEAGRSGHHFTALLEFFKTVTYSPRMARERLLRAWLTNSHLKFLECLLSRTKEGFTGQHGDLWIGPIYRTEVVAPAEGGRLVLTLKHIPQGSHKRVGVTLRLNKKSVAKHTATIEEQFILEVNMHSYKGKQCKIEIHCDSFFIPRYVHNTPDDRHLSMQLIGMQIIQ